jgi:hypothetical protein
MIQEKSLRTGVWILDQYGREMLINEDRLEILMAVRNYDELNGINLTKEWCRDFGFEITDMGDFWEYNKGDFQLIQFKVPLTNKVLEPVYVLHSKKSKHIKVPYVHKLQNLYYEIEETELILLKK